MKVNVDKSNYMSFLPRACYCAMHLTHYTLTCTKGWSGFRKTPGFFSRADLEPVCPVTGCVDTWRAVATDCSRVSSPTWGPTARSARGNSISLNSKPSKSHARRPSSLFSQNSCKMKQIPCIIWIHKVLWMCFSNTASFGLRLSWLLATSQI